MEKQERNKKLIGIYYVNILIFIILCLMKVVPLGILGFINLYLSEELRNYLMAVNSMASAVFNIVLTLVGQYGFILVPVIIYLLILKKDRKQILKFNKISLNQILLIVLIALIMWILSTVLNSIFYMIFYNLFGEVNSYLPEYLKYSPFILNVFILAITPAICEEILFRGAVLSEYQKLGMVKAIFFTSLIFGMMHCSLNNFVGPFLVGIVSAYIVIKSNSLYSGIILHFVFNLITIIIYEINKNNLEVTQFNFYFIDYIMIIIMSSIAVIFIYSLLKSFNKECNKLGNIKNNGKNINKIEIVELKYREIFIYLKEQWSIYGFLLLYILNVLNEIGGATKI